jgi:hypothetical protein
MQKFSTDIDFFGRFVRMAPDPKIPTPTMVSSGPKALKISRGVTNREQKCSITATLGIGRSPEKAVSRIFT